MADEALAPPETAPRKRESWSLKTMVEEISGRPIEELQEPGKPPHPYIVVKSGPVRPAHAAPEEADPVDRVYPPLSRAHGRSFHGSENEHHGPTLRSVGGSEAPPEEGSGPTSPSKRPERIYLHYLMLHLDRLNPSALHYLRRAIDEELQHRAEVTPAAPPS